MGTDELDHTMSVVLSAPAPGAGSYRHLSTRYDPRQGALWCFLDPRPRPSFTPEVLEELRRFQREIEHPQEDDWRNGVRFVILASKSPGVFNLGGDLPLLIRCVLNKDQETLRKYAKACIDVLYPHAVGFHRPITTISLVQGDALGGGFEAALASDILVAERSAKMGFPEVLFDLFPGMGAYNLLSRRISPARTERMLLNGKLYDAEELHAEGVVDILAENGRGENAVYEHILRSATRGNAREAVLRVKRRLHPIRYEQLLEVIEIWVDAAMRLGSREIQLMGRLARSQELLPRRKPVSIVPVESARS